MLPLFFEDKEFKLGSLLPLSEETARHVVQVLRKQPGDTVALTNGKGFYATVRLETAGKKAASVRIEAVEMREKSGPELTLAVAFTKAAARNEWLLEKAAELGTTEIIPLLATRSERERFRRDRWEGILVSAMLQSGQTRLATLHEPQTVRDFLKRNSGKAQRFIAHCDADSPRKTFTASLQPGADVVMMIGPEGDFTPDEVREAVAAGFIAVTLGHTRLRTETAAMTVAAHFRIANDE